MKRKVPPEEKFRQAAWAFFLCGTIDLLGSIHLFRIDRSIWGSTELYIAWGASLIILPYLIAGGGSGKLLLWLSRLLTVFVFFRCAMVAQAALESGNETTPLPWGGEVSTSLAAWIYAGIALVTGLLMARAAWFYRPR